MTPLATSYSTTPFLCRPQTITTSLTYHLLRSIFSLSDGVLRRPVELAGEKRTSIDPGEMSAYDPKRTPQPHYKMLGYPFHRRGLWRGHMRRRQFIAGTAATAAMGLAQPICAQTNARPGVKRIAIFHPTDPPEQITSNANRVYKAYFDELKKHGYIEGQNLIVERYSALGHPDRIGDLAREIVANHPDVVLPLSGVFLKEFMALHSFIPMVGPTPDPVAL